MRIDFARNTPDLAIIPSPTEVEILIDLLDTRMELSAVQTNAPYMDTLRKMRTSLRSMLER